MSLMVQVRVPASSANLGPGFDCLAVALDVWNEVNFSVAVQGVQFLICGEGRGQIPLDETNLVARAAMRVFERVRKPMPGLRIECRNDVPLGGGLGSSATAVVAGLLGANALLDDALSQGEILQLAAELEGHADNAAAALLGGLVVVTAEDSTYRAVRLEVSGFGAAVVVPEVFLPTKVARAVLPKQVPLVDAVYNMGRTALVVQALQQGDLKLLGAVMDDRLHQPYRLKLIAGAEQAMHAAREAGAAGVALSGAGPALIAFSPEGKTASVVEAMVASFDCSGVKARGWSLGVSGLGAVVTRRTG